MDSNIPGLFVCPWVPAGTPEVLCATPRPFHLRHETRRTQIRLSQCLLLTREHTHKCLAYSKTSIITPHYKSVPFICRWFLQGEGERLQDPGVPESLLWPVPTVRRRAEHNPANLSSRSLRLASTRPSCSSRPWTLLSAKPACTESSFTWILASSSASSSWAVVTLFCWSNCCW